MSARYAILHTTEYRYSAMVQTARHIIHLVPRTCEWQTIEYTRLVIDPVPAMQSIGYDIFNNQVSRIELRLPHSFLRVTSEAELTVHPRPWGLAPAFDMPWEVLRRSLAYRAEPVTPEVQDALMMRFESPGVRVKRELEDYALVSFTAGRGVIDSTRDLMARIHREFRYDPEATEVGTSVLEVLEKKHGVCQDFAHLMVGCLRAVGLGARYVSGYLRTEPPPGQQRLIGVDASHAWMAVYVPKVGWLEFDPTNNCLADERYLILGWGRDFADVSPIRGVIQGGGEHELQVGVTVTPL